jgi:hypothetical protein
MPKRKPIYLILIALGTIIITGLLIFWPKTSVNAQCGSQASSCKNCHETQAQDSVNGDGTQWHTQHQQIDACVNCHAGNPQSTDKAAAHTGMVAWNSDVKAGCNSCHPTDYMEKAEIYATTLGVQTGDGGATSGGNAQPTSMPSSPTTTAAPVPAIVVNEPGEIDYVKQYDETVLGKRAINWGNIIVSVLIAGILLGGGAFVYWNERRLRGLPGFLPFGKVTSKPVENTKVPIVEGYPIEVTALLPMLAKLNPQGLHALQRILRNPDQANDMLHALSHVDPELIRRVKALDDDSRALLLALAGN